MKAVDRDLMKTCAYIMEVQPDGTRKFCGSAFLIVTESDARTYAITNRHVAQTAKAHESGHVHMAPFTGGGSGGGKDQRELQMLAMPGILWVEGTEVDIAVAVCPLAAAVNEKLTVSQTFVPWNQNVVTRGEIEAHRWWEGTEVITLGYPHDRDWTQSGREEGAPWPTVRTGTIARMQDWLSGREDYILADMASLDGQSGSPVFIPTEDPKGYRLLGVSSQHSTVDSHLQVIIPAERIIPLIAAANMEYVGWSWERQKETGAGGGARGDGTPALPSLAR